MKTKLIAALITLTMTSPVFAQLSTTFGQPDCGQWVNATQGQRPQRQAWLLGWLTGANTMIEGTTPKGQTKPDYLAQLNSAEQAFLFVDNYCRANPLSNVGHAADQLIAELITKQHKK
jgi:hypothetical protein